MYYGWVMVGLAAAAMVGTLPGRTQGLGLVTEPLLADLRLGRVEYAQLNLWATLIGSLFAIGIGRLVDRLGTPVVLTTIAATLGVVVSVMSFAHGVWVFAIALTLTRGLGQSALSVVSIAMVGHWFVRRIDLAMAIYSIALSVGFMIAFPVVGAIVQFWGWRTAWLFIGIALVAGLAPLSWLLGRRNPESIGLRPDGDTPQPDPPDQPYLPHLPQSGYTWQQAIATPAFWLFSVGTALYGLVASGIGLFNESILAERGFGPEIYYQTLVVTAMTVSVEIGTVLSDAAPSSMAASTESPVVTPASAKAVPPLRTSSRRARFCSGESMSATVSKLVDSAKIASSSDRL